MIKDIIKDILSESNQALGDIEVTASQVYGELKDTAKQLFFEGNMNNLKDFIFDIPNEKNDEMKAKIGKNLSKVIDDGEGFIVKLRDRVILKIDEMKKEKNVENLLDLFDYGHLKGFLNMFK